MQVFIMRHGDAALDAASDSVRPLTSCGCDESRLMANWLKGQKVDIERVLVSPFLRAEQTLDVVGECMNLPTGVDVFAGVDSLRRCRSGQRLFTGSGQ